MVYARDMQICEQAKVGIVGCGRVGMSTAYSLLHRDCIQELVLLGRNSDKVHGEALDLDHGSPFLSKTTIIPTVDYADLRESDVVVFAAGVSQKPSETRLDLTRANMQLLSDLLPQIIANAPEAIIVIVTNPVDILVQHAREISTISRERIISTGTMLDTARFRFAVASKAEVSPNSVHAYIFGEHGDNSVPIISSATIGGQRLADYPGVTSDDVHAAYEYAQKAAYEIIEKKGATYYAIGAVTSHLIEVILKNKQKILPVSVALEGEYGLRNVALSVPCVVSRVGVERVLTVDLNAEEHDRLQQAAAALISVKRGLV